MSKKTVTIVYNTAIYVYKFRMNLIKKLQDKGYHIVVMAPYDSYVEKLKSHGIEHYDIQMSQYGMNPIKEIVTLYQYWKAFKNIRPVLSLHYTIKPNIYANIAALFSNTPVINNIAGAGKAFADNNKPLTFLIENLFKFALSASNKVFFQNNDDMNLFLKHKLVSKEKSERIPGSGVDLNKFTVPKTEKNNNEIVFLFIGRLLIQKGIRDYLEAASNIKNEYKNIKFLIVGEHEDYEDYIETNILNNYCDGTTIAYLGRISPDKMPEILNGSDCVVLPSYYREGVPRSLLEAAATGKPIITTNSVGCKEVVDEGYNGFKCNPKDIQCITNAMKKLIEMPKEKRIAMGNNGRLKMEKEFDENYVLDRYMKAISKIS